MAGWIKRNLERFETFCRNHKVEIIAALIGTAVVGTGVVICRNADKALSADGQDILNKLETKMDENVVSLERVKEILDLNAGNTSQFAIFREGPNPSEYVCMALNDEIPLSL